MCASHAILPPSLPLWKGGTQCETHIRHLTFDILDCVTNRGCSFGRFQLRRCSRQANQKLRTMINWKLINYVKLCHDAGLLHVSVEWKYFWHLLTFFYRTEDRQQLNLLECKVSLSFCIWFFDKHLLKQRVGSRKIHKSFVFFLWKI